MTQNFKKEDAKIITPITITPITSVKIEPIKHTTIDDVPSQTILIKIANSFLATSGAQKLVENLNNENHKEIAANIVKLCLPEWQKLSPDLERLQSLEKDLIRIVTQLLLEKGLQQSSIPSTFFHQKIIPAPAPAVEPETSQIPSYRSTINDID